jgi:hypothetical protein
MHAVVSFISIILTPEALTGARLLTSLLASAATMWLFLAAVVIADRRRLSRQPRQTSNGLIAGRNRCEILTSPQPQSTTRTPDWHATC